MIFYKIKKKKRWNNLNVQAPRHCLKCLGRVVGMNWEIGIDIYSLLYRIDN